MNARRIRGRPDQRATQNTINVILIGDGFVGGLGDINTPGSFLFHANAAMDTMLNTHPFNLFRNHFIVYAIGTQLFSPNNPAISYFHTVTNPSQTGGLLNARLMHDVPLQAQQAERIRNLANRLQSIPRSYQTILQIISNARSGTGFVLQEGRDTWYYDRRPFNNTVKVAITSIHHANWHGILMHEIGHTFGHLVDEFTNTVIRDHRSANFAPYDNIKWEHWFDHRDVEIPVRRSGGHRPFDPTQDVRYWAVPANIRSCMMFDPRQFPLPCGVCSAELIRRMALITGETFMGRSPSTIPPNNQPILPPDTEVAIPSGATRILDSAFHGNTNLQTLTIPETVREIGDFAFIGATNLRTINNRSMQPQPINDTTFAGIDRSKVSIHVPLGTKGAFEAVGWSGFHLREALGMPAPAPAHVRIDFANERLTGFVAGHTYRIRIGGTHHSSSFTPTPDNPHSPIQENWMGSFVSISRIVASPFSQTMEFHLNIPERPAPPTPPPTGRNPTVPRFDNGQILGVRPGMQWRAGTSGHWQPVHSIIIMGLRSGTYEVRYQATGTSFASAASRIVLSNQIPELYSIPVRIENGNGEVLYSYTLRVYHDTQINLSRLRSQFLPGIFEQGFIPGYHFSETAWLCRNSDFGICEDCCDYSDDESNRTVFTDGCEIWVIEPNFSIVLLFLPVV